MTQMGSALCGEREGLRPFTPPPFEKGRRVPVAHKQGADRSGSEDLIETFMFVKFIFYLRFIDNRALLFGGAFFL